MMEVFFAFLIKLSVIFIGGGIVSLIAFKVAEEMTSLPELILNHEKRSISDGVKISKKKNIISKSGLYELILPGGKALRVFSSFNGMQIFKD